MEDDLIQQPVIPTHEKPYKSKKQVVGTIYAYIVGAGVIILLLREVVIGAVLGIDTEDSLVSSAVLGVFFLIVTWFLLRNGIEKMFKKNSILPNDFLKISIFVALIPFIGFLFTLFFILIDEIGVLQALVISGVYAGFTIASGIFYGTATYFWLRKFSQATDSNQTLRQTRSTLLGGLIIIGTLLLAHAIIVSIATGGILIRQQLGTTDEGVAVPQTTGETANWQTYRNEEFGFEVKYPQNWSADVSNFYSIVDNTVVNRINFGEIGKEYYAEESRVNAISIFIQGWDGKNTPLDLASKRSEHIGTVTQLFVAGEKTAQSSNYVGSVTYLIHSDNLYTIATTTGGPGEILDVYNSMLSTFRFTGSKTPGISILSPLPSVGWEVGSTHTVYWETVGIDNVRVSHASGGKDLGSSQPIRAENGVYASYTVPDLSGFGIEPPYTITLRVYDDANQDVYDTVTYTAVSK